MISDLSFVTAAIFTLVLAFVAQSTDRWMGVSAKAITDLVVQVKRIKVRHSGEFVVDAFCLKLDRELQFVFRIAPRLRRLARTIELGGNIVRMSAGAALFVGIVQRASKAYYLSITPATDNVAGVSTSKVLDANLVIAAEPWIFWWVVLSATAAAALMIMAGLLGFRWTRNQLEEVQEQVQLH